MKKYDEYITDSSVLTGKKPLISVCVVIYNVGEYLTRCVNSILSQTYENLEVILVDDGSTDGCSDICDSFAVKDKRVKVIHKKNGGVSSARNAGIEAATGEYFTYVDGDDYIDPDMYEILLSCCLKENADLAVCRYRQVDSQGVIDDRSGKGAVVYEGLELLEAFLKEDENFCIQNAPWNKLYRTSLIGSLRFPEGIYEDALYTPELLACSERAVYIDRSLYNYVRDRQTSIMNKCRINASVFTHLIPNYEARSEFIKTLGRDDLYALSDYFLFKRLLIFITALNRTPDRDIRKQNIVCGGKPFSKKDGLLFFDRCIRNAGDRIEAAYSVSAANPREYGKMKIYLASPFMYRIVMALNDRLIIPFRTGIHK